MALMLVVAACGGDGNDTTTTAAGGGDDTTTTAGGGGDETTTTADGGSSDDDPRARTLIYGADLSTEISWDPHIASVGLENAINPIAYDTLIAYDGNDLTTLVPSLATEWEVAESGDRFTFTLDPAATFNTGNKVTAEDVAFSFMRLKHIAGPASYLAEAITSVDVVDEETVAVNIANPNAAFLRLLTDPHYVVLEAAVVREHGGTDAENAAEVDTATAWLGENSAGSGSFQLESVVPNDQLVFVTNPNAWRPAVYFERVIVQNAARNATQAAAVQQGDIDITQNMAPQIIESLPNNASVAPYGSPGTTWYFVAMNRNPELNEGIANEDVQRAVHLALDYEGMYAMGPSLAPWYGMVPDYFPGGVTKEQAVTQDVDEAKALMAGAGYSDGFEVELCTSSASSAQPTMLDFAQKVQSDLAEIGITIQITAMDGSAFLTRYRAGECAMVLTIDGPTLLDPTHMLDFTPNGGRAQRIGWIDGNLGSDGQRILDQVAVATAETDEDARLAAWNEIVVDIAHNGPYVSIASMSYQYLASSDLEGLDKWANSHTEFNAAQMSRSTGN